MIDYLASILIRVLSFVFCLLPVRPGLFIGGRLGGILYILNSKRRRIAYANLKAAFSEEKSPAEINRIVKGVYRNLGQVIIEVLRFPAIGKKYIGKFLTINGQENIREARLRNQGIIALTAHFGNWELLGLMGGFMDLPLSVLAREQKHTRLNELLNAYREKMGSRVIKKGLSTRQLIKALRSNEIIGILADQDAGKLGLFVDFFGRPTSTHSGAFVFAQKTGAKILPIFIVREKGPYHRLEILEPIELNEGPNSKEEIIKGAQAFSRALESYVRKFPTQWLWLHKRWKSTPRRSIIILNDGRQGHLNQSTAVAEIMQKFRQDRGYKPEDTTYKIIDVSYKNKFSCAALTLCSVFSPRACQGCMACARACLKSESYKAIINCYADIVISCGSSLAPVNVLLARELNAKNIVIMKPGALSLKKFSLAIVPRHDNPRIRKNILVTTAAPNRITTEALQNAAERFSSALGLKKEPMIGIILGGDNADYKMEAKEIKEIISQVIAVSRKLDLGLLVTTSRRTPKAVERLLKDELAGFENCKLLVIANEKNMEGAVPAILGLCGVVLVSGESISMLSEAASSGKTVLTFSLSKIRPKRTRHEILVKELNRLGFVKLVDIKEIGREIEGSIKLKVIPKRLNDYEKIYSVIGGLL